MAEPSGRRERVVTRHTRKIQYEKRLRMLRAYGGAACLRVRQGVQSSAVQSFSEMHCSSPSSE